MDFTVGDLIEGADKFRVGTAEAVVEQVQPPSHAGLRSRRSLASRMQRLVALRVSICGWPCWNRADVFCSGGVWPLGVGAVRHGGKLAVVLGRCMVDFGDGQKFARSAGPSRGRRTPAEIAVNVQHGRV
jgi:hypothetical protein